MATKTKIRLQEELLNRHNPAPKGVKLTFLGDLIPALRETLDQIGRIKFPTSVYRNDPVRYCEEILGVTPWHKQVEILEALRDYPRVAVKSGHKVSKSHSVACAALWLYCSYEDAKVVLTSTTSRQVDEILWLEIRKVKARGGRCIVCKLQDPDGKTIPTPCPHSAVIPEEPGDLARTGLKSKDFRSITGFTAREAEAVAGVSGKNLWYFVDEASGVGQPIFEAIEGNRAGGARVGLFGNPTRNEGEFYDAFHTKKDLYHCITVSSEETPNVQQKKVVIPGLAEYEWVEEKKREWGPTSALYTVRVKGEHAKYEEGKIFTVHDIAEAEKRLHEVEASGRTFCGLDPAGASGQGDESAFSFRRGKKHIGTQTFRGLTEEAHLSHLLGALKEYKVEGEVPVVVIDREGQVGSKVYGFLKAYAENHPLSFELVGVRTSELAFREPDIYGRVRDEVVANFERWIRDGGAIQTDTKLAAEMHAFWWTTDIKGKLRATDKPTLKKLLGRSPDRFDSLCLACWEPLDLHAFAALPPSAPRATDPHFIPSGIDPYAGVSAWEGHRRGDDD